MNSKHKMNSRLALKLLRAFILLAFALLAGFVVFCLAVSAQASPAKKAIRSGRPAVKPTVKIGQPYRVERLRPVSAANANALYLYWRDSVQFKDQVKSFRIKAIREK